MKRGKIVILTGAGISAESGIDTFRDKGGLWEKHRVEDVATPEAFERNPKLVQDFYNKRRRQLLTSHIEPNTAHIAIAKLEAKWPNDVCIITQNIDPLHEQAGSKQVIHMHGELLKVRCTKSEKVFEWNKDITPETRCACCNETDTLRPHVVWFGEMPFELEKIHHALHHCDLFIAIGTSGNVYPAAGFVQEAKVESGAHTVELNLEPSEVNTLFDEHFYGKATEIVPKYVEKLLEEQSSQEQNS